MEKKDRKLVIAILVDSIIIFALIALIIFESTRYTNMVKFAEYGIFLLIAIIPMPMLISAAVNKYRVNKKYKNRKAEKE